VNAPAATVWAAVTVALGRARAARLSHEAAPAAAVRAGTVWKRAAARSVPMNAATVKWETRRVMAPPDSDCVL
jgi:hypothetical protein